MRLFRDSQGSFSKRFITCSIVNIEMLALDGLPVKSRVYCERMIVKKEYAAGKQNELQFFYDLADYFLRPFMTNSTPVIPDNHASTGAPNIIGTESANA
jgi:hypothetical protein